MKKLCNVDNGHAASGSAKAAQVLTGYTFSNIEGIGINGEMTDNSGWSVTPATKQTTIPKGYHDGSGTITLPSISFTINCHADGSSYTDASEINLGDFMALGYTKVSIVGRIAGTTSTGASHLLDPGRFIVKSTNLGTTYIDSRSINQSYDLESDLIFSLKAVSGVKISSAPITFTLT